MIRKIQSGRVMEISCFPVGNATKPRRGKKKGSTTTRKQDQNFKQAERRLAQTINCNYVPGDIWLTLKYSPKRLSKLENRIVKDGKEVTPDTIREYAISDRNRFLRRVKRDLEKLGIPLKYIAATSDVDGSTGELVRIHHHLILQAAAFESVFAKWSREEVDYKPLRNQEDYTPIAEYIIRQCRRQPDEKKYTCSRNLSKPVVLSEKIITVNKELKAPRGATVLHRSEYNRELPCQYVRYVAPKEKKKRGGKRE